MLAYIMLKDKDLRVFTVSDVRKAVMVYATQAISVILCMVNHIYCSFPTKAAYPALKCVYFSRVSVPVHACLMSLDQSRVLTAHTPG